MLILYNFSSVSLSDNQPNTSVNTLTTKYILNMQNNNTSPQLPSPMLSKEPSALNNKVNLNAQTYDYNKYFYV